MKPFYLLVLCLLPVLTNGLEIAVGSAEGLVLLQGNDKNYTDHKLGGYTLYGVSIHTLAVDTARGRIFFARTQPLNGVLVQTMSLRSDDKEDPTIETVLRKAQGPETIRGLVYDEMREALYWTDEEKGEISMISVEGGLHGQNATVIHNFEKENQLSGIAIDACRGLLFWTMANHKKPSVERSNIDGSSMTVIASKELFLPYTVTIDPAGKGRLFWADTMEGSGYKIEMSQLDGSGREILIQGHFQTPFTISYVPLDSGTGMLLWTDTNHNSIWEIEISDVGKVIGKSAKVVYKFQKMTLALVASTSFSVSQHHTTSGKTEAIRVVAEVNETATEEQALSTLNRPLERHAQPPLQEPLAQTEVPTVTSKLVKGIETTSPPPQDKVTTTRAVSNESHDANSVRLIQRYNYCINGEVVEDGEGSVLRCQCSPGYSGPRCEKSMCDNYCVHGSCSLDQGSGGMWEAKCTCRVGFIGRRCERDPCWRYCLNGGRCRIESDNQPKCSCQGNGELARGERCERLPNLLEKVCTLLCSLDSSKSLVSFVPLEGKDNEVGDTEGPLCVCPPGTSKYQLLKGGLNTTSEWTPSPAEAPSVISPIVLVLSGVCFVLLVIALYLTFKVMKLRRLPRIKKRIIVSKGSVPLASANCGGGRGRSPTAGSPVVEEQQQCEITIENCCNMNICETPCFEPQLRSPGKSSSSKTSTKEEKKVLLVNMEGPKTSCGPCPGAEELY